MGTMFDTVSDPKGTFAGLEVEAIAAYGNGSFANFKSAKNEFPAAHVLEIDVNGQGIGDVGDFEAGDMAFSHVGSWAKARIEAGVHRPVIYFSVSNWSTVMGSLRAAGLKKSDVRIWTAHYNGVAHLCSADCGFGVDDHAHATQWGSANAHGTLPPPYTGRAIDVSMTGKGFFPTVATASGTVPVSPVAEPTAQSAAKHLLRLQREGRYTPEGPADLHDIRATAKGHQVHCVGGRPVHLDERVVRVLIWLIEKKGHTIGTFAICSDHGFDSPKGHAGGFAVDISRIDGQSVASASARAQVIAVDNELHHAGELTPRQLISGGVGDVGDAEIAKLTIPDPAFYGAATMAEHCNHVHVGY
jgi:hypothetical protein